MADNVSQYIPNTPIIINFKTKECNVPQEELSIGALGFDPSDDRFYVYTGDGSEPWISFNELDFGTYTNLVPTPEDVGGIEKGTTFLDVPYERLFDTLLYPFQKPYFNTFRIESNSPLNMEIGETFLSPVRVSWSIFNYNNANLEYLNITLGNEQIPLQDTQKIASNTLIKDITPLTRNIPDTLKASITCSDKKNREFKSELDIKWQFPVYSGISVNEMVTEDEVLEFPYKRLADDLNGLYEFGRGGGYQYIVYPKEWGDSIKITDENDFEFAIDDLKTLVIVNKYNIPIECNIIRSKNYLNSPMTMFIKQI